MLDADALAALINSAPVPCDGWMPFLPEMPCDWRARFSTLVCCPGCGWKVALLCPSCVNRLVINTWGDRSGIVSAFCRPCGRLPVSVPFDVFQLGTTRP